MPEHGKVVVSHNWTPEEREALLAQLNKLLKKLSQRLHTSERQPESCAVFEFHTTQELNHVSTCILILCRRDADNPEFLEQHRSLFQPYIRAPK